MITYKKLTLMLIVAILACSTILVFRIRTVRATWAGGTISDNVTWSAVNNPYVLIDNLEIAPNATLTMEAGTEVRVGGYFSITVKGALLAIGTPSNRVLFTSNKLSPAPNDWEGIINYWDSKNLVLKYCTIEYAHDGILVRERALATQVENTIVRKAGSSTFGSIWASNVTLSNCEFRDNVVYMTYSNHFTITKCVFINAQLSASQLGYSKISQNSLQGNGSRYTTGINVGYSTTVFGNTITGYANGIGAVSSNISVYNNLVFGNVNGIVVGSDADSSTQIFNNSIYSNTVGILHTAGSNIQVHYNNIYANTCGENVTSGATSNSTYNYWGATSGPYHVSLNPTGTGNAAGGNGIDLRFIPFLSTQTIVPETTPVTVLAILMITVSALIIMYRNKRKH